MPPKVLSIFLSLTLFSTQCALAHRAETSLWADRIRKPLPSPALPFPPPLISPPTATAADFSELASLEALGLEALGLKALGTIREIHPAENQQGTVFIIQDIHGNAEAQSNISRALRRLAQSQTIDLLALEGSFSPLQLTPFHKFPDQETLKQVTEALLEENKISGAMHAALISASTFSVVGVDHRKLYLANVESYRRAIPVQIDLKKHLMNEKADAAARKRLVFNPALLEFDEKVEAYRNGKLSLTHYAVEILKSSEDIPPALRAFVDTIKLESSLNFSQVEVERSRLINELVQKLNSSDRSALTSASLAYRQGQFRHKDFYASLKTLCLKNSIDLARFPAMDSYLRYVFLADQIEAKKVLGEARDAEKKIFARLARTTEERTLIEKSRRLYLTAKLLDFSLTKDEWSEYKKITKYDVRSTNSFEDFYRLAEARDKAIVENLMAVIASGAKQPAQQYGGSPRPTKAGLAMTVLVIGGFHSDGIIRELNKNGFTTVSFVPKISKVDMEKGSAYLSVFTQEKTPLSKLFEGEKLFLSPPQWTEGPVLEASLRLTARWHSKHPDENPQRVLNDLLSSISLRCVFAASLFNSLFCLLRGASARLFSLVQVSRQGVASVKADLRTRVNTPPSLSLAHPLFVWLFGEGWITYLADTFIMPPIETLVFWMPPALLFGVNPWLGLFGLVISIAIFLFIHILQDAEKPNEEAERDRTIRFWATLALTAVFLAIRHGLFGPWSSTPLWDALLALTFLHMLYNGILAPLLNLPVLSISRNSRRGDSLEITDLPKALNRFKSASSATEQIKILRSVEDLLTRVHNIEAIAFDVGGVLLKGHNKTFLETFSSQVMNVEFSSEEILQLHEIIFKLAPEKGGGYAKARVGQGTSTDFENHALEELYTAIKRKHTKSTWPGLIPPSLKAFKNKLKGRFLQSYYDSYREIPENVNLLDEFSTRPLPLFAATNTFEEKWKFLQRTHPSLNRVSEVRSDEAKAAKPDRSFYTFLFKKIREKIGHIPNARRILFIDDKKENLEAAHRFGFLTTFYDSNQNMTLRDNPIIHELLTKDLLTQTRDWVDDASIFSGRVKKYASRMMKRLQKWGASAFDRKIPIHFHSPDPLPPSLEEFYRSPLGRSEKWNENQCRIEILIPKNSSAIKKSFGTGYQQGDRFFFLVTGEKIVSLIRENSAQKTWATIPPVGSEVFINNGSTYRRWHYYAVVLNALDAYRSSGLAPPGFRLVNFNPPLPKNLAAPKIEIESLVEKTQHLVFQKRRGANHDSPLFRKRVREAALQIWAQRLASYLGYVYFDTDEVEFFNEAPTLFMTNGMDAQMTRQLGRELEAYNHQLTLAYYQSVFVGDEEAVCRAMVEGSGLFEAELHVQRGPIASQIPMNAIVPMVILRSKNESREALEVEDMIPISSTDYIVSMIEKVEALPVVVESVPRKIPVVHLSRNGIRRPFSGYSKYLPYLLHPEKIEEWEHEIRPGAAMIAGRLPLGGPEGPNELGQQLIELLAKKEKNQRVAELVAMALDRWSVPATDEILEDLIGPWGPFLSRLIPPCTMCFREIVSSNVYHNPEEPSAQLMSLVQDKRTAASLRDLLKQNNIWGRRGILTQKISELRNQLSNAEKEVLDILSPDKILVLVGRYQPELDAIYDAEAEVRQGEFQMVYAHAKSGLGQPMSKDEHEHKRRIREEVFTLSKEIVDLGALPKGTPGIPYDKARQAVAKLINRDGLFKVEGRAGLLDLQNALERLGLDITFAFPYHRNLKIWKACKAHAIERLLEDGLVKNYLTPNQGEALVSLCEKASFVVQDRQNLKDIRKPLLIFLMGASGVGKSTLGNHLTQLLGLNKIQTDPVRAVLQELIPDDILPVLHRSSFEWAMDDQMLKRFYEHAQIIMGGLSGQGGVSAAVRRAIKSGESTVVEGVVLVPGIIPEEFYQSANVLHFVIDVAGLSWEQREKEHILRFTNGRSKDTRDLSRAAQRYLSHIKQIRTIQISAWELGDLFATALIPNGDPVESIQMMLPFIINPYSGNSSRRHPPFDDVRRKIETRVAIKTNRQYGKAIQFSIQDGKPFSIIYGEKLPGRWSKKSRKELIDGLTQLGEDIVMQIPSTALPIKRRQLNTFRSELKLTGLVKKGRGKSAPLSLLHPIYVRYFGNGWRTYLADTFLSPPVEQLAFFTIPVFLFGLDTFSGLIALAILGSTLLLLHRKDLGRRAAPLFALYLLFFLVMNGYFDISSMTSALHLPTLYEFLHLDSALRPLWDATAVTILGHVVHNGGDDAINRILSGDTLDLGVRHLEELVLSETNLTDQNVVVAVVDPFTRKELIGKTVETLKQINKNRPDLPILVVAPENLAANLRADLAGLPNVMVAQASKAFGIIDKKEVLRLEVVENLLAERNLLDRRAVFIKRKGLGLLNSALGRLKAYIQILFDDQFNLTVEQRMRKTRQSKTHA